ncbi:hypothetical protein QF012_005804 [Pseudomonas laurylsulfatiphila]
MDHLEGSSCNVLLGISNSVMLAEITANRKSHHLHYATPGTAAICDLLIFIFHRLREDQDQKIATSDNSYRDFLVLTKMSKRPLFCWPLLKVITAGIVANIYLGIVGG